MLVLLNMRINKWVWLMKCSNCEKDVPNGETALEVVKAKEGFVASASPPIVWICATCQQNVLVMKIVLRRESPKDDFKFAQYLPVETDKT